MFGRLALHENNTVGVCWFSPTTEERPNTRVDRRLGKWALVDTFVMTLMLVAFHFDVTVGDTTGDPQAASLVDAVTVRVFVEALPSFFVYVLASCLSLVLGHVTVARHRSLDLVDDALATVFDEVRSRFRGDACFGDSGLLPGVLRLPHRGAGRIGTGRQGERRYS